MKQENKDKTQHVWNKNPIQDFIAKIKFKKKIKLWFFLKIPKTSVEQIKGNGEFYLYLYPLST